MGRTVYHDDFYEACLLSFQGLTHEEIGVKLDVTGRTVSGWAQREEWKSLQEEFRAAKRKQVLEVVLGNETST